MKTSESKGRFFTKRIDSHNESNRCESRIGMLYYPLDGQHAKSPTPQLINMKSQLTMTSQLANWSSRQSQLTLSTS